MIEKEIPLCELNLPPSVVDLTAQIERAAGRPVSFRIVDAIQPPAEGAAAIEDGQPIVRVTAPGCRPSNILHELLHLECELAGFPRTETVAPTRSLSIPDVQDLASLWSSLLEHRVIYERMIKLGFDPHLDLDRKIEAKMETLFDPKTLAERTTTAAYRRAIMITMVVRCLLECTPDMARRVAAYARSQGFGLEVDRATAITSWVRRTGKTPEAIGSALIGCLKKIGIPSTSIRFC